VSDDRKPKHMMGKTCGYELFPDGSIKPAAAHYDSMDRAVVQEAACQSLLAAVTRECQTIMIGVQEAKHRFWVHLREDYDLSDKVDWYYNSETHVVSKKPKAKP